MTVKDWTKWHNTLGTSTRKLKKDNLI